jgi:hypothetical protein
MKTVGRSATIPESRLSKQIATIGDAAANEEEVEEQIEEDNVKRVARENATGLPIRILRGSEEMAPVDDAVAAGEEVEEQGRPRQGERTCCD